MFFIKPGVISLVEAMCKKNIAQRKIKISKPKLNFMKNM